MNENKGFKQTEIGPIPEDWEVVKLGEVVYEVPLKERQIIIEKNKYYKRIFTKLYGKGVAIKDIIMGSQISTKIMFIVKKDDFIFSKINIRKGAYGVINNHLDGAVVTSEHPILRARTERLDINFLSLYLLQPNVWNIIKSHAKGFSGKERVKTREFLSLLIPLPPLQEQKNIAYVLSTIQEAIEKTDAVLKATKELKKSLMKHLFTYGPVSIHEIEKVKLKETEIGPIPEDWEVVRLGDLKNKNMLKIQFGFPCGKWNDIGSGIPQLRPFNINEMGYIDLNNLKYIQTDKDISNYLVKKGDIIFNNTNSEELVGKTAYFNHDNKKFVISNHMTIIRVIDERLSAYFIAKYLHKKWYEGYYKIICRRHVNQCSINLARLSNIPIPLPPLPVQQKIAEILSAVDEKIQAEENKKKALQELFKSMLHNLMSGKIRVKDLKWVSNE
ncbi:restriction endonuclease subunit S [Thermocrinis minervae]|uniref:restriction endonuclease subunit S n=1 Tax=Thermocrinis minervae TaxID=381751 RepID=UPI003CCD8CC7